MSKVTRSELSPWNDGDDLLRALNKVESDQAEELIDVVAELLSHDDSDVREEAIRQILVRWKVRSHRQIALDVVRSDEPVEIRCVAAFGIAATSDQNSRDTDTRPLITILRDEGEAKALRSAV